MLPFHSNSADTATTPFILMNAGDIVATGIGNAVWKHLINIAAITKIRARHALGPPKEILIHAQQNHEKTA